MKTPQTIKFLLKKRNISQKELANRIGKSEVAVSQIVNGKYNPNPETMEKIADVLEVPVPVINILSLEESDVKQEKRELFNLLMPSITDLMNNLFEFEQE